MVGHNMPEYVTIKNIKMLDAKTELIKQYSDDRVLYFGESVDTLDILAD